jgi:hypothetical protein
LTEKSHASQKPDRLFMYVNHHQIEDFLLCGWVMSGLTTYGVLMEWLCSCPPRTPKHERHVLT